MVEGLKQHIIDLYIRNHASIDIGYVYLIICECVNVNVNKGREYSIDSRYPHTMDNGNRPEEYTVDVHYRKCWQGQLSEEGVRQLEAFGAWLRRRYVNDLGWLPATYNEDIEAGKEEQFRPRLWVQSTSVNRTLASVDSCLLGLYPQRHRGRHGTKIAIHTDDRVNTWLWPNWALCPRWREKMPQNVKVLEKTFDLDWNALKEDLCACFGRTAEETKWNEYVRALRTQHTTHGVRSM